MTISFDSPVKEGDAVEMTCEGYRDDDGGPVWLISVYVNRKQTGTGTQVMTRQDIGYWEYDGPKWKGGIHPHFKRSLSLLITQSMMRD